MPKTINTIFTKDGKNIEITVYENGDIKHNDKILRRSKTNKIQIPLGKNEAGKFKYTSLMDYKRIWCFAFKPIDGLKDFYEYKTVKILNNEEDNDLENVEWALKCNYTTENDTRSVYQFNTKNKFIKKIETIQQAYIETGEMFFKIYNTCNKEYIDTFRKPKFNWSYNEDPLIDYFPTGKLRHNKKDEDCKLLPDIKIHLSSIGCEFVKFQEEEFDQQNQKTGEVKKLKRQRVIFKCHCGKISDALKQYCVTGKDDSITGCRECSVRQNDPETVEKVKNVINQ